MGLVRPAPPPLNGLSASKALETIAAEDEPERIGLGDLVARLGDRAFGVILLVVALPNCLPMPPGSSGFFGALLMLVAVQMIIGRHRLWLPALVLRRSFSRSDYRAAVSRFAPLLKRLERLCRPRLTRIVSGWGERLLGVVVFVLAVVISLPIPIFGNLPPAVVVGVLAVSMIERDGVTMLIGYSLGSVVVALNAGVVWAALLALAEGLQRLAGVSF
jgi:hypothetical protein